MKLFAPSGAVQDSDGPPGALGILELRLTNSLVTIYWVYKSNFTFSRDMKLCKKD